MFVALGVGVAGGAVGEALGLAVAVCVGGDGAVAVATAVAEAVDVADATGVRVALGTEVAAGEGVSTVGTVAVGCDAPVVAVAVCCGVLVWVAVGASPP